jgi:hypothetical protein
VFSQVVSFYQLFQSEFSISDACYMPTGLIDSTSTKRRVKSTRRRLGSGSSYDTALESICVGYKAVNKRTGAASNVGVSF